MCPRLSISDFHQMYNDPLVVSNYFIKITIEQTFTNGYIKLPNSLMSDFIPNEDRQWDQLVIRELVACSQQFLHIFLLKILLKNQFWNNETLHLSMQMRSTLYSFAFLYSQKLKAKIPEVTNYIAGCFRICFALN